MRRRTIYRIAFAGLLVVSASVLASGYLSGAEASTSSQIRDQADIENGSGQAVAPPRDGITVVATDSNTWLGEADEGPRARAELVAFNPNGTVLYYNDTHTRYWDVDPVPGTEATVTYVAATHLNESACSAETVCTRNSIERVNLSTGEVDRLYSRITPHKHSTRWHDADRVNDTHYAVADIAQDRVFVVNATSGMVTWAWDAQQHFDTSSGGPFPSDWTHVNDVEVLPNGTLMASMRNQDQVVFIDRQTGVIDDMTLGAEDNYSVLYEQHNPDYIPESEGGPAVVVGDSENNRVVEYQRENGEWTRTWLWRDARMQWPRDADRLPNGHTLVTDSNGNRVFELNRQGEVVWSVDIAFPYESERLNTGDESAGGPSAKSADIAGNTAGGGGEGSGDSASQAGLLAQIWLTIKGLLPGRLLNAVMYVLPVWAGPAEILAALVLVPTALVWVAAELYWAPWSVGVRWPFSLSRRE